MKWEHETWRKLYVRASPQWSALPVYVRGLGDELLRICDDDGIIPLGGEAPGDAVARLLCAHRGERKRIAADVETLVSDGYLVVDGGSLRIRNFVSAQTRRTANAERQAKWRERHRETPTEALRVTPEVTSPETSHETSRVTPTRAPGSVPFRSEDHTHTPQPPTGSTAPPDPDRAAVLAELARYPSLARHDPERLADVVQTVRIAKPVPLPLVAAAVGECAARVAGEPGIDTAAVADTLRRFVQRADSARSREPRAGPAKRLVQHDSAPQPWTEKLEF